MVDVVELLLPVERGRAVVGQQLAGEAARGSPRRSAAPRRCSAPRSRTRSGRRRARRPARARSPDRCPARTRRSPRWCARRSGRRGRARSTSLVSRFAPLASVRAMTSVGTPSTSAASRAATSLLDGGLRRDQHLAAHVAALLLGGELVLEMDARGAGLDHRLHDLEGVERPAEARLGVGHDRREPVRCRPCPRNGRSGRRAAAPG